MLAGRLDGDVNGRPFSLIADGRDITVDAGRFSTLLGLRSNWRPAARPLQALFRRAGLRLLVRVPWFGRVEVSPNPSLLLRMILPQA